MTNTYSIAEYNGAWVVVCIEDDYPDHPGKQGITDFALTLEHAILTVEAYLNSPVLQTRAPQILVTLEPNRLTTTTPTQQDTTLQLSTPRKTYTNRYGVAKKKSDQVTIHISNVAWSYLQAQTKKFMYDGHGPAHGCTQYILALLRANPTHTHDAIITHWTDTRPDYLREFDAPRATQNLFPYWFESPRETGGTTDDLRVTRTINARHLPLIEAALWPLAQHFLIVPARGRDQLSPKSRAQAALEAIGRQFLTPLNSPVPNPTPANVDRRKYWRDNAAKRKVKVDLVF